MLVTGETGAGKSAFLKHYAAGNPSRRDAGCLVQPVVFVELAEQDDAAVCREGAGA